MFYSVIKPKEMYVTAAKWKIIRLAKRNIFSYSMGPDEIILNKYFETELKIPLKALCIKLLEKANYLENEANEIIIKFANEKDSKLAQLITYGSGELPGSKILRDIFKK